jgi:PucR C-terminal helix-turn-helix domain
MKQHHGSTPSYGALLETLRRDLEPIVREVARDTARADEDLRTVSAAAQQAVEWTIGALLRAEELSPDELARLRLTGSRAAREGEPLQRLLDRYLTSGWVLWAAATRLPTSGSAAFAALGTALLKAGDSAAGALAEGYGQAEREIAARAGAARREFLDELLELAPDDPAAAARITRRSAHFGLVSADRYRVIVAAIDRELEDEAPEVLRVTLALDRPGRPGQDGGASPPIVATTRGRLVLLARASWPAVDAFDAALDDLAGPEGWLAVEAPLTTGLAGVAPAFGAAFGALLVAERFGLHGHRSADELLLERSLLADEGLLRAAIDRELGPILDAPRNGEELLRTVAAYVAAGQNLRGASRALGIGVRTVSYRLTRVEVLLGRSLAGEEMLRLATSLFARRLLVDDSLPTPGRDGKGDRPRPPRL